MKRITYIEILCDCIILLFDNLDHYLGRDDQAIISQYFISTIFRKVDAIKREKNPSELFKLKCDLVNVFFRAVSNSASGETFDDHPIIVALEGIYTDIVCHCNKEIYDAQIERHKRVNR